MFLEKVCEIELNRNEFCILLQFNWYSLCRCLPARQMLEGNGDMKRKWSWAVEWLNDELERVCTDIHYRPMNQLKYLCI